MLTAMKPLSYPILPRLMYAALWLLALPMLLLQLGLRSVRQPAYRQHWGERLGSYPAPNEGPIWVHAASLGEVRAIAPLLALLAESYPDVPILITCQTPAGRLAAEQLALPLRQVVYLPFDAAFFVRRFLAHFKPRIAVVVETEIWPTLYLNTRLAGIPLLLINARLSARSLRGYRRFGGVFKAALAMPDAILCQSAGDAERFVQAGAPPAIVSVSGNLKWQGRMPASLLQAAMHRRAGWPQTPVWMAASTHPDEEALVLRMHRALLAKLPGALLIWAPRHPERFNAVSNQVREAGLQGASRSQQHEPAADTQVFIIDSLGELAGFMPGLDMVFVGGSIQAIGGHNVLEPAVLGVPVLVGPHTANFKDSVALLAEAGGLRQCSDADSLQQTFMALMQDPAARRVMSEANRACVVANQGALEKTKALIAQRLA